MQQRCQKK